ncbi:MAG: hypothetical protein GWO04_12035 [Actinobacteria bacterium]|nr:hypothetical protein [Actinomycetota bacterium]
MVPAETNFVLAEVGEAAAEVHAALLAEGMVVRDYPDPSPLAGYLRFTVRSDSANERLISALRSHLA